jgi:hypothetical protein
MNNQPAETTTAPPAVFTETRMTAQISQIRTAADGIAKFKRTSRTAVLCAPRTDWTKAAVPVHNGG